MQIKKFIFMLIILIAFYPLFSLDVSNIQVILGERKTLLRSGALGLDYFPDEAVTVLQNKPVFRALVTSGIATYLVEGIDIEHLTSARKVLAPGPKGSFDNGYTGVSGAFYIDGKWYAIYHGEDQEDMPIGVAGISGHYCRVGLAVSSDGGNTWEKVGPVISSCKPKEWTYYKDQPDRGAGDPGLVVDINGKYVYIYYTEHSRMDGRGVQICMARALLPDKDTTTLVFYKYYNGEFNQPGIGGFDTPIISAWSDDNAEAICPNVTYSAYLEKYVMVFNIDYWKEFVYNTGLNKSGIFISYSDDVIHWSEPVRLIKDYCVPLIGKSLSYHAMIVFDDNTGREGWLVYSYTPRWGHKYNNSGTPHYMVGSRIRFDMK